MSTDGKLNFYFPSEKKTSFINLWLGKLIKFVRPEEISAREMPLGTSPSFI